MDTASLPSLPLSQASSGRVKAGSYMAVRRSLWSSSTRASAGAVRDDGRSAFHDELPRSRRRTPLAQEILPSASGGRRRQRIDELYVSRHGKVGQLVLQEGMHVGGRSGVCGAQDDRDHHLFLAVL